MIPAKLNEKIERLFSGDQHVFWRNLFTVIGIVMVRRGVRHLLDEYLFPLQPTLSSIVSILIGIIILYIPDRSLSALGGHEHEARGFIPKTLQDIREFFSKRGDRD